VRPHVIVVGCTSVSGLDEGALEQKLAPEIEAATGASVVTVLPGVVGRLHAWGCRQTILVTPHGADVDAVVVRGLEAAGLVVRAIHSMGIRENFDLGRVPPAEIVRFVADRVPEPLGMDGLFLSCTNFRSLEAQPALQRRYGSRVVTSVGVLVDQTLDRLSRLRRTAAMGASLGADSHERGSHGA